MRKFGTLYKEQQTQFEALKEGKVLDQFKSVYSALLEKYNITEFYELNEKYQKVFLTELNSYWTEEDGLLEKGEKFLSKNSDMLNESSTTLQKKNFLKKKSLDTINETIRQSDLKWKIYAVLDEMYKETEAEKISDVLSPDIITDVIKESFVDSVKEILGEINFELTESSKSEEKEELNEKEFSKKKEKN